MILGLRAILCVPLKIKNQVSGVVYVDNRLQAGVFTQADLDLLTAIASSAAIAIENARLYQVAVEKGRMEQELQMAYDIQAGLLPHETPQLPGWEFAARWQPAREVSGDYYDFIPLHDGRLGIAVADVSDKGMPAALFMALTRSTVRASMSHAHSPADGIARANQLICDDAADGMFVTLFYALLDPQAGEIAYVNAGHNPPLLYRAGKNRLEELTRTGMAMGVVVDSTYEQRTVRLDPGDFVLLYTDGVTDAINPQEQEFGEERLRRTILQERHTSMAKVIATLEQTLYDFAGTSSPFDDITIVAVRRS